MSDKTEALMKVADDLALKFLEFPPDQYSTLEAIQRVEARWPGAITEFLTALAQITPTEKS